SHRLLTLRPKICSLFILITNGRLTYILCRMVSNRWRPQKKRRSQGIEARRSRRDRERGREAGAGVSEGVRSLTPTGMVWTNMRSKIVSAFKRDKRPYHV